MRKKSLIWEIEKKELVKIIKKYGTLKAVLDHLGFAQGGNYRTLKERLLKDRIDHKKLQKSNYQYRKHKIHKASLEELTILNSSCSRNTLKRRIIETKLLKYECSMCGLKDKWNGQEIVLVLDHINGIRNDNRIENLRFICPNCNSQTKTFAGRNNKIGKINFFCKKCFKKLKHKNIHGMCIKCYGILKRKVKRPTMEQLEKEIEESSYCSVGKKYGVSDNAIRKWMKNYG